MVIWQASGDEIVPGKTTIYFEKQTGARTVLREYRKKHGRDAGEGPTKVVVKGRAQLVALLNGSIEKTEDGIDENEFI